MKFPRFFCFLGIFFLCLSSGYATNGFHPAGQGAKARGMAGAGVAYPQEAMASFINPASSVYVPDELDVGVRLFAPFRSYQANTGTGPFPVLPGKVKSKSNYFVIPEVAYNHPFANGRGAVGFSLAVNGGLNTDYSASVFGAGDTGGNLRQIFLSPTISWRFTPQLSAGISVLGAIQSMELRGIQSFAPLSIDPANLSNRGENYAYGVGVKLGFIYEFVPEFRVGASVQPPVPMTKFNRYKGVFEDHGRFNVPATSTIGFAWTVKPPLTLVFDVQHIAYSTNKALHNKNTCTLGGPPCLGVKGGSGFGWKNLIVYKVGAQWQAADSWTFRCGYSHTNQTIRSSEVMFNILAPAVIQDHVSVGVTKQVNKRNQLNFAFGYAFNDSVSGQNQFSPDQTIKLSMYQYSFSASWEYKF